MEKFSDAFQSFLYRIAACTNYLDSVHQHVSRRLLKTELEDIYSYLLENKQTILNNFIKGLREDGEDFRGIRIEKTLNLPRTLTLLYSESGIQLMCHTGSKYVNTSNGIIEKIDRRYTRREGGSKSVKLYGALRLDTLQPTTHVVSRQRFTSAEDRRVAQKELSNSKNLAEHGEQFVSLEMGPSYKKTSHSPEEQSQRRHPVTSDDESWIDFFSDQAIVDLYQFLQDPNRYFATTQTRESGQKYIAEMLLEIAITLEDRMCGHHDLTPANLLLRYEKDEDGTPKLRLRLTDFSSMELLGPQTEELHPIGTTLPYASPIVYLHNYSTSLREEYFDGFYARGPSLGAYYLSHNDEPCPMALGHNARNDIWSVGLILLQLLSNSSSPCTDVETLREQIQKVSNDRHKYLILNMLHPDCSKRCSAEDALKLYKDEDYKLTSEEYKELTDFLMIIGKYDRDSSKPPCVATFTNKGSYRSPPGMCEQFRSRVEVTEEPTAYHRATIYEPHTSW